MTDGRNVPVAWEVEGRLPLAQAQVWRYVGVPGAGFVYRFPHLTTFRPVNGCDIGNGGACALRTLGKVIEFTGHLDAAQPPEVAFDLLADMALLSRWNPNVVRSEIVSGTPLVAGARFVSVIEDEADVAERRWQGEWLADRLGLVR